MKPPIKTCWCCQSPKEQDDLVQLDRDLWIPCCQNCWGTIPPAQQLAIGQKFISGPAISEAMDALKKLIRRSIQEEDWPPFLRN